jgi:hypothetical protein
MARMLDNVRTNAGAVNFAFCDKGGIGLIAMSLGTIAQNPHRHPGPSGGTLYSSRKAYGIVLPALPHLTFRCL